MATVRGSSKASLKPLKWVGGSKKSLDGLPEDVKDVFGSALLDVQYGDTPDGAKPFGEGLPHEIWKVVEDFDGSTYRARCMNRLVFRGRLRPRRVCEEVEVGRQDSTGG